MNFLDLVRDDTGRWMTDCGSMVFPVLPVDPGARQTLRLGVRPEHLEVIRAEQPVDDMSFVADVLLDELLGADALLRLGIGQARILARVAGSDHPIKGDRVSVRMDPAQLHLFDSVTGRAIRD